MVGVQFWGEQGGEVPRWNVCFIRRAYVFWSRQEGWPAVQAGHQLGRGQEASRGAKYYLAHQSEVFFNQMLRPPTVFVPRDALLTKKRNQGMECAETSQDPKKDNAILQQVGSTILKGCNTIGFLQLQNLPQLVQAINSSDPSAQLQAALHFRKLLSIGVLLIIFAYCHRKYMFALLSPMVKGSQCKHFRSNSRGCTIFFF